MGAAAERRKLEGAPDPMIPRRAVSREWEYHLSNPGPSMHHRLAVLATLSILVTGISCGGDSSTTPVEDDPVTSVTISPARDTILVDDAVSLQASARTRAGSPATGVTFAWTSTASVVASVDAQGRVTGHTPGTAEIRATTEGVSGAATIVVRPRPITSIEVSPATDTVRVGEQTTLTAIPRDDQGAEVDAVVAWTSDDPDIAAVVSASAAPPVLGVQGAAASGVVTGVGVGTTTLRATVGEVESTATIVVEAQPVATVEVATPTGLRVGLVGAASATPRTVAGVAVVGCQITWTLDDATVADVAADGAVTALAAGSTTVSANADCGPAGQASGSADLTVDPSRVVATAAGRRFGCALVEDASLGVRDRGSVYCWGANDEGQVGDGTFVDRSAPIRVGFAGAFGGSDAGAEPSRRAHEMLVAGDEHACSLDETGAAWCWGDNRYGQLGDGTFADRPRPVRVSGGHTFKALTAGEEFTCGVDGDDKAWCWGQGSDGQLGDNAFADRTAPVPVSGGHAWTMLRAGEDTICGITTDGKTYCWGDNDSGGVGDGTTVHRRAPTLMVGPTGGAAPLDFTWLGMASDQGCALEASTGFAWCWGDNEHGQLGIGVTGGIRTRPTQVSGSTPFRTLSNAGDDDGRTNCGIVAAGGTDGGAALCWGANEHGQLGDGTTADRNVPTPLATDAEFLFVTSAQYHTCAVTTTWQLMCWGEDARGQLGDGPPLLARPTPAVVSFPPQAPRPVGGP